MANKDQTTLKFARSSCPVASTLDILGDKWTLLVVRDLFAGKKTFSEFQSSPERIPTNILADRLKRLVENEIIEKRPYQARPVRYEYTLTSKGKDLGAVLKAIVHWGEAHLAGTRALIKPVK